MRVAGRCRGCDEAVAEGEFCYRILGRYWCRGCVERAAVLAGSVRGRRGDWGQWGEERQIGQFREREMAVKKAGK